MCHWGQGDWEREKNICYLDSTVFCRFWPCMTTWKDTRFIVPYYRWYDVSIGLDIVTMSFLFFFDHWDSLGTVLFLCILCKEYQKILFNFCNVLTLLSGMLLGSNFQFLFAEVNFFLFVLTLISVQSKSLFGLMAKCRSLGCMQYILTHNVTFIKQLFKNKNVFVRSCIFPSESQYC